MKKVAADSILAGLLISIGGTVYLSCENRYIGAILFAVALLCICCKGYYLYTGKIGYLVDDTSKQNIAKLAICLVVNCAVVYIVGIIFGSILSNIQNNALVICTSKLMQPFYETFIRGTFCGMLMYLAVSIYKQGQVLGIIYCVPVFILSGFEHSIADMFYFAASGIEVTSFIGFITIVVIGNTLGSILISALEKVK